MRGIAGSSPGFTLGADPVGDPVIPDHKAEDQKHGGPCVWMAVTSMRAPDSVPWLHWMRLSLDKSSFSSLKRDTVNYKEAQVLGEQFTLFTPAEKTS